MQAVFHVKTVVADQRLLVTSANLSDNAQKHNCELGIHYPNSMPTPVMSGSTLIGSSKEECCCQLQQKSHQIRWRADG